LFEGTAKGSELSLERVQITLKKKRNMLNSGITHPATWQMKGGRTPQRNTCLDRNSLPEWMAMAVLNETIELNKRRCQNAIHGY
jgi:hypothetical protein